MEMKSHSEGVKLQHSNFVLHLLGREPIGIVKVPSGPVRRTAKGW